MYVNWLLVLVIVLAGTKHAFAQAYADESTLLSNLLTNYDSMARPVNKVNETVTVKMNMATLKIDDIDEKNQLLRMRGWIYQEWTDPRLIWKPEDHGNIQELRIPINKLWNPDIVLYNYAEYASLMDESHSEAVVHKNGLVVYYPIQTNIKSSCQLDLSKFPYDRQTCWLMYGPWTSSVARINITVGNETLDVWYEGHEWKVIKTDYLRKELTFKRDEKRISFSVAMYGISIERNPVYYQHVFVIPAVLLICIVLFIFLVPTQASERLTLCGLVMVAITILLLMIENHLPTEVAEAPLLLRFLLYTLFLDVIAVVVTITSLNFYHRDIRRGKVPNWMRKVFLGKLSKYMCMRGDVYSSLSTNEESVFDCNASDLNTSSPRDLQVDRELTEHTPLPSSPTLSIEKTMDEIRRYLRILVAKTTLPEPVLSHRQIVVNEWHQVALVLDRLMFVSFSALTIFIAIVMAMM